MEAHLATCSVHYGESPPSQQRRYIDDDAMMEQIINTEIQMALLTEIICINMSSICSDPVSVMPCSSNSLQTFALCPPPVCLVLHCFEPRLGEASTKKLLSMFVSLFQVQSNIVLSQKTSFDIDVVISTIWETIREKTGLCGKTSPVQAQLATFPPLSPLLLFLFYASDHFKTFMNFYMTFNYSLETSFPIYLSFNK